MLPKSLATLNREFVEAYSKLKQFHGVSDRTLIRLAEGRTGLHVRDRWIAIALIMRNPTPIPVVRPAGMNFTKREESAPALKFKVIPGGKRVPRVEAPASKMLAPIFRAEIAQEK